MSDKDLIVKENGYLAVSNFNDDSGLMEEMDGLTTTFDKVKIPSGGGLMFEVTGENGEPEPVKIIEGVILYHHAVNSFYKEKYTGGNNPPDCGSYDGKIGEGDPGGDCSKCPYNQFGTGDNGTGKACKNKRRIFILREGELFPVLLSLPTGSLKEFTGYIRRLVTKGKRSHSLVTKLTLKKANSSTGIQFSQAVFSAGRSLSPSEIEAIAPLAEHIRNMARNIALDNDQDNPASSYVDEETGEIKPLN